VVPLVLPPPETEKNGKAKEKNRSVERSRSKTEKKRKKNRSVNKKQKLKSTVCCVFGCFAGHRRRGREEGRKPFQIHPSPGFFRDGGAWRRRLATVHLFPEVLLSNSWSFGELFCNF